jgi:predicted transcriptional regulator
MNTREQFLEDIDAFLAHTGMSERQLGDQAVNDAKFVARIRAGSSLTVRTLDRVRKFMRDYRPNSQDGKPRPRKAASNQAAA